MRQAEEMERKRERKKKDPTFDRYITEKKKILMKIKQKAGTLFF